MRSIFKIPREIMPPQKRSVFDTKLYFITYLNHSQFFEHGFATDSLAFFSRVSSIADSLILPVAPGISIPQCRSWVVGSGWSVGAIPLATPEPLVAFASSDRRFQGGSGGRRRRSLPTQRPPGQGFPRATPREFQGRVQGEGRHTSRGQRLQPPIS